MLCQYPYKRFTISGGSFVVMKGPPGNIVLLTLQAVPQPLISTAITSFLAGMFADI
jgi:hypothetical protein